MAGTANASSSLEHFFETSLKKLFLELHHNMSAVGGSPERRLAERDSVGPVVYIMVFIAILSFFIISLLVIAVKSRSYEQQPDHQRNPAPSYCDVSYSMSVREPMKSFIHKNTGAE
ncbi:hypothetical protein XENTR_v10004876 [Xenopus tropicalis]|nr:hypothetical protein XENTR_v10004876 [Xenopus tropicalis]